MTQHALGQATQVRRACRRSRVDGGSDGAELSAGAAAGRRCAACSARPRADVRRASVRSGSSCISMKSASTPNATAARAQRRHVLALAAGSVAGPAGQLHGVRRVEHDRISEGAHDRETAHVDDEVIVAEARAALGQQDGLVALRQDLVDDVLHVVAARRTALLRRSPACPSPPPRGAGRSAGRGMPGSGSRRGPRRPGSTSLTWWTSDSTGTRSVSRTLRRMRRPSTRPGPR